MSIEEWLKKTNKKFHVVAVTQNMIFKFFDYTRTLFKKIICSVSKTKFTIMAYRYIKYTEEMLCYNISENSIGFEDFHLEKNNKFSIFS